MKTSGHLVMIVEAMHAATIRAILEAHRISGVKIVPVVGGEPKGSFSYCGEVKKDQLNELTLALREAAIACSAMCKMMPTVAEYYWDERQAVLDGIHDFNEWLKQRVRLVLNFSRPVPFLPQLIFQPCWSSRRWKSLT